MQLQQVCNDTLRWLILFSLDALARLLTATESVEAAGAGCDNARRRLRKS
jgi:hypothetical protein